MMEAFRTIEEVEEDARFGDAAERILHPYGETQVGDKYMTTITGSNVSTLAHTPREPPRLTTQVPTQEQLRKTIADTQGALVRDQDALDKLDTRMYEALNQFLRLARDIQVEQQTLGRIQAGMKNTLGEVWVEQAANGMKPELLPETLEVARAITANPIMVEVAKKLIAG